MTYCEIFTIGNTDCLVIKKISNWLTLTPHPPLVADIICERPLIIYIMLQYLKSVLQWVWVAGRPHFTHFLWLLCCMLAAWSILAIWKNWLRTVFAQIHSSYLAMLCPPIESSPDCARLPKLCSAIVDLQCSSFTFSSSHGGQWTVTIQVHLC